jgi:hypothetical protein
MMSDEIEEQMAIEGFTNPDLTNDEDPEESLEQN